MLESSTSSLSADIDRWLATFEQVLAGGGVNALAKLFHTDCHWRDLVALTWHIKTLSGQVQIAEALRRYSALQQPNAFKVNRGRTAPRRVMRIGREAIEAIFQFETKHGRASGLLRLIPDEQGNLKVWTLLTALDEIKGCEEQIGHRRPRGESFSRDFRGPNWLDQRRADSAYRDNDPDVLIVGGGQGGLTIAARLKQLGVDTLIVDREQRIGDNWRTRYHALTLHNQVQVNHFPYMSFPPTWPTYIPKDKLANWFEMYVEAMELNFWTGAKFTGGTYDETAGRWSVVVEQAAGKRTLHPRHIVLATGVCGTPRDVQIAGLDSFAGQVLHSSQYGAGADWAGRDVLVVGTGNSGHDIAQDLYSNGARVALVQRSPTSIFSIEPSGQLPYAIYNQGDPLEDCDLIAASVPLQPLTAAHKMMTAEAKRIDQPLLDRLVRAGFRLDEEDQTGWLFKYMNRGGGYYFNVGCSELIADGKIPLIQFADIDRFVASGARMRNGELKKADLVVLATGYHGPESLVKKFFGEPVANRVGRIWGYDPESQEVRNAWGRTPQPGLWFMAGSFAQCRIYSKYLAQQIKAVEVGLI
jgi:Pyridine nucleotide-disulphide oxidoreductase